jgi:hypothetical protein
MRQAPVAPRLLTSHKPVTPIVDKGERAILDRFRWLLLLVALLGSASQFPIPIRCLPPGRPWLHHGHASPVTPAERRPIGDRATETRLYFSTKPSYYIVGDPLRRNNPWLMPVPPSSMPRLLWLTLR